MSAVSTRRAPPPSIDTGDCGSFVQKANYEDPEIAGYVEGAWGDKPLWPRNRMRMFTRVGEIRTTDVTTGAGIVRAEFKIDPNFWVFRDHFKGDPVYPASFELDALWATLGFYLGWLGAFGFGRALEHGHGKMTTQIKPDSGTIFYETEIQDVTRNRRMWIARGSGLVRLNGKPIYQVEGLKVGIFPQA